MFQVMETGRGDISRQRRTRDLYPMTSEIHILQAIHTHTVHNCLTSSTKYKTADKLFKRMTKFSKNDMTGSTARPNV